MECEIEQATQVEQEKLVIADDRAYVGMSIPCVISICWLSKRHEMDMVDNLNFRVLIFPERKKKKLVKKKKERKKEAVQKLSSSSSEGR